MRAGKRVSFLSWAVSTSIRSGPFGHKTATKSRKRKMEKISVRNVLAKFVKGYVREELTNGKGWIFFFYTKGCEIWIMNMK